MSIHPSEATQAGRTDFWNNIVDKELERYHQIVEEIRPWKPIDFMRRKAQLKRLEDFIMRATVVVRESREADEQLAIHSAALHQEYSAIQDDDQPHLPPVSELTNNPSLSKPDIA